MTGLGFTFDPHTVNQYNSTLEYYQDAKQIRLTPPFYNHFLEGLLLYKECGLICRYAMF